MIAAFDPYFKWLGIPGDEQPPSHYRLLGIPKFVSDPDVIENAADQRMAHVRTLSHGQHMELAQRILNEISTAKITLLDPHEKQLYDEELRDQVSPGAPQIRRPAPRPSVPPPKASSTDAFPFWTVAAIGGTCSVFVLAVIGTLAIYFLSDDAPAPIVQSDVSPATAIAGSPPQRIAETNEITEPEILPGTEDVSNEVNESNGFRQPVTSDRAAPKNKEDRDDNLLALVDTAPEVTDRKSPVPSAAVRKAAQEKVDSVFGDQISSARAPDEKRAIAQEMIKVGDDTRDLAIRFALYQQAIDLAKEVGDARIALSAADRLDASFEGDTLRLKASILHGISQTLRRGGEHVELATLFDVTINTAVAEDRFDIAEPLAEVALQSAMKSGDIELRKAAVRRVQEVGDLAKAHTEVVGALAKLQTSPTDGDANLLAGKYYAFLRNDWRQGLTYLALANNEQLKGLASEELKEVPDAMKLGDGWWQISEELPEPQSLHVQLHAAQHYRRVLPSLSGFAKAAVEKRLESLPDDIPLAGMPSRTAGKVVDLIAISDPTKHGEKGRWRKVDGKLAVNNLEDASFLHPPFVPSGQYDLQVTFARAHDGPTGASDMHIRLPHGDDCHTFGVRAHKDGSTSLSFWGDKPFGEPPLGVTLRSGIRLGRKHTLLFQVRDAGVTVFLDGKEAFAVADYSILRNSDDGLGLGSYQNQTVFYEAVVREVSTGQTARLEAKTAVPLFNGRDLSGWTYVPIEYSKSRTNKTWFADPRAKALVSTGGDDFNELRTVEAFGDFRLSLQWRFRPGGPVFPNGSGIVVRASGMDRMNHNPRGVEIDLRPNQDVDKNIGTGCLLAYATPLKNHTGIANGEDQRLLGWLRPPTLKEGGGWNECVITCKGDRLEVEMNGEVVNRAWGLEIPKGQIVLRNQKTAIEFRDIHITDLSK